MERVASLTIIKNLVLYLPESFEWIILKSGVIPGVKEILKHTSDYIESQNYFSWERFFTALLVEKTQNTFLHYQKATLNPVYIQEHEKTKILDAIPEIGIKQ